MRIAVMALQGAFAEHRQMVESLGAESFEVRRLSDWEQSKDGLILPGGESTAQLKLLKELNLLEPVKEAIRHGLPVYGTCAGLILLAKKVEGEDFSRISTMDTEVVRNAYGRQLGSFSTEADFAGLKDVKMVFIRAPYIEKVSGKTQVLAETGGHIVAAREGRQLATSFHPEISDDNRVHKYFLDMAAGLI